MSLHNRKEENELLRTVIIELRSWDEVEKYVVMLHLADNTEIKSYYTGKSKKAAEMRFREVIGDEILQGLTPLMLEYPQTGRTIEYK
jgi:hypothetical protein